MMQLPAAAAAVARVRPRPGKSIAASPLSVGMETLDRRMFDPARTYQQVGELGVKWARLQTGWARTERVRGEFDFRWLDDVVDNLLAVGVQPWFNLGYGNPLYIAGTPHETAVGWAPMEPAARDAWVRYVRAIAGHFHGRVRHWELWNEPNIKAFWRPREPDAAAYADLVKLTAPQIRRAIPDAVLIGGALAGLAGSFDFLERALDAGLARHVQRISYHPYRALPENNYESEVRTLRGLLARYGNLPIWQGENGAPSVKGGTGHPFELDGTERQQAKWLLRRILTDLALSIELTSYFHLCDLPNYIWATGPSGKTQHMGLLRADYTPKPAYHAYQTLCALFDAGTSPADLLVAPAAPDTKVAAFLRRGYALCAWWRPAPLTEPYAARQTRLQLWTGSAARLDNPVLIDPLTGEMQPLAGKRSGGGWTFDSVPLADYPMLVADSAAL